MVGISAYQNVQTQTASPWKLIDMLYEGAIKAINQKQYQKAETIIDAGLIGGLNPDVEFSQGMLNVYEIAIANLYTNPALSIQVLTTMREGWQAIKPKNEA